jgi:hypothetical protein
MWFYSRVEESLRQWYEFLATEKSQEYLAENAEGNPFFAALADSLAANELPPFEAIAKYMTPSVGVLSDPDTGFHGIGFTIRSEVEP